MALASYWRVESSPMANRALQTVNEALAHFSELGEVPQGKLRTSDFSLGRIQALSEALGHPEHTYPIIHIAGTNGKGSVAVLCASALQAQGYQVGQYSSPHLAGPLQGMCVNGRVISPAVAANLLENMQSALDKLDGLTRFEVSTMLALKHFAEAQVDVGVIEVGLGGLLDATNIVAPLVSVITPIDLEHRSILGNTLAEIAAHKAGIIKTGKPVVMAPQQEEARQVIMQIAKERTAPLVEVGRDFQFERRSYDQTGQTVAIWPSESPQAAQELRIRLLGAHQAQNAATAYAALHTAQAGGLAIELQAMRSGFAETYWPGRFELVQSQPPVVLDAAHTPAAARVLAKALNDHFPTWPIVALVGLSGDKDIPNLFLPLRERLAQVVLTQSRHPRAMPVQHLASVLKQLDFSVRSVPNPAVALELASKVAGNEHLLLVFGSVFLVEEIHELL